MSIRLKQFSKYANAGDVASSYIVSKLLRQEVAVVGEQAIRAPNLVAIGSILHWADEHSVVWGSGFLSASTVLRARPARIVAVRGHHTRERLVQQGMPAPHMLGDPGLLISDFFRPGERSLRGIGLVPHYMDLQHPFVTEAQRKGALLISPLSPLEEYLASLAQSSVVISSSLHGIVFAHSYGIPAAWIRLSEKVLGEGFKFWDYYSSIGFAASELPELTEHTPFEEALAHASLPRREIDRVGLRQALMEAGPALLEAVP